MMDEIASFQGRVAKVQGAARSGKTEALVRRAATLLEEGVDPHDILMEASSGFAAQALRERLADAVGEALEPAAREVRVRTPLQACVEVLDAPPAHEATGRVPRLLTKAEYAFFLEDLKTTGTPRRKLRNMLAYFYRMMAQDTPEDEWRIGGEEEAMLRLMRAHLTSRGAMLAEEAPALASAYLRSPEGAQARGAFAYVLADDFQNMSHAQQNVLCLLAGTQLVVAGNPNQAIEVASDHPDAQGFARFEALRRGVRVFELAGAFGQPDVVAYTDALCAHGDMDPSLKAGFSKDVAHGGTGAVGLALEAIKWNTPNDEVNGLSKYILTLLDQIEDLKESRTCVLVPNKRWARMAARMLRGRGYEVSLTGAQSGLSGDPRSSAKAPALVAYTKLTLLAHPLDMTAWRSWCGLDHALTNSDAWAHLRDHAKERGLTLYEALEGLPADGEGPFPRAQVLAGRFREGRDFIAKNAPRKGYALLHAVGADKLAEFGAAEADMVGDEDALALFELVRRSVTDPVWPEGAHVLRVATCDALCGCEYDNVFVMAAVDGFIPNRDAFEVVSTDEERAAQMNRDRRRFMSAVSKANGHLVVSYFAKSDLELAEKTKMQVTRVRAEDGARMAIVRPSSFLAEGGNAAPTTTGGQALLAGYGLN